MTCEAKQASAAGRQRAAGCLYSIATFANLTGAPICALNHALQLRRHFEATRLVLPGSGELIALAEAAKLPVLVLPIVNRGLRKSLLRPSLLKDLAAVLGSRWNYFRSLCREFRRQPGIVHVHDRLTIAPLALLAARWCGQPAVLHVHYPARTARERRQLRFLACLAKALVFVSDGARRCYDGNVQRRAKVIHNFMELPVPSAVPPHREFRMAMVSQMSLAKGPDLFLWACTRLRDEGMDFLAWMVGPWADAGQREAAQRFIREHQLEGRVEIRDHESDMDRIYREIDLLVLPTRRDAFPRVVMEAMCHGLPVVATRIDGVPEMVVDGETGFLVEPDDVEGFAAAMANVLRDADLRRRLGAAGRERARHLFSPAAYENAMLELYRSLSDG